MLLIRPRFFDDFSNRLPRFRDAEDGALSVETVLWLPFYLGLLAFILDASHVLTTNASMWDASRDAARRLAYHRIDAEEVPAQVMAQVMGPGRPYSVIVEEDHDSVAVETRLPAAQAGLVGQFARLMSFDLVARVTMMREPV